MEQLAVELFTIPDVFIECANNLDFMRGLPNESMKLIVTSPPYNIGKAYERRKSLDVYLSSQAQVVSECVRLLHPKGSICWQIGNHVAQDGEVVPLDIALYPTFKSHRLILRNRIIWHFEHGLHCTSTLLTYICMFRTGWNAELNLCANTTNPRLLRGL